jgi:uncharacterized protein (TIGR01244 family)
VVEYADRVHRGVEFPKLTIRSFAISRTPVAGRLRRIRDGHRRAAPNQLRRYKYMKWDKSSLPLGLLALSLLLGACGKNTPETQGEHKAITGDKLEPYECGDISKLHTYGGIFLASQPAAADFDEAKKDGVKTVINLRHPEENKDFDEAQVIADIGLAYHNTAWKDPEEFTDEIVDELRNLLSTAERPILLHCASANRVGAVWLVYRALDDDLPIDEALAEAKAVGLKSPDFEAKANDYIERHRP